MQTLANLAWSMAHLGFKHEGLLDAIISLAVGEVEDILPRDVAELLSCLAMLSHVPPDEDLGTLIQHVTVLLMQPGESAMLLATEMSWLGLAVRKAPEAPHLLCRAASVTQHSHAT